MKALGTFLLALTLTFTSPALAQPVPKETQIQAVFLWRFAQFVQWPSNAFVQPDSPLVIGVLGESPFGDALNLAVKGETAQGRRVVVKYLHDVSDTDGCHVLYISTSE